MEKKSSESSQPETRRVVRRAGTSVVVTPEMREELEFLKSQSDEDIDTSAPNSPDISEWPGEGFLFRERRRSIVLDEDVFECFSKKGDCQEKVNDLLRELIGNLD